MTCGELWIKVNVNHLRFYPLSSRQCSLVALRTCRDFSFLSISLSLFCLLVFSSIPVFTYTTPHANFIPQVTVAHTPSQFLTHPQGNSLFFPFDSSQNLHLIYLPLISVTTRLSAALYTSLLLFLPC